MKKHPTLIYFFCDILSIPEGEVFLFTYHSFTERSEVRVGYRGVATIRDSVSCEGHFSSASEALEQDQPGEGQTLGDTLLLHVNI